MAGASRAEIDRRIDDLDHEWDVERALETNAAALILTGLALGAWVNRRWFGLSGLAGGFLLQHALQGWCPPLPLLRGLGFRTQREIEEEKTALRILRGDFRPTADPGEALALARPRA